MILVTVGTQAPFDRLVEAVESWASGAGAEVFYQIGRGSYLPKGEWARFLDHDEMMSRFERADLLVGHAGIGTILKGLEAGKKTVIMPRRGGLGEHRDDHQFDTARHLSSRGLVFVAMDESALPDAMARALSAPPPRPIGPNASPELIGAIRDFIGGR